jgi:hypothetical protein
MSKILKKVMETTNNDEANRLDLFFSFVGNDTTKTFINLNRSNLLLHNVLGDI